MTLQLSDNVSSIGYTIELVNDTVVNGVSRGYKPITSHIESLLGKYPTAKVIYLGDSTQALFTIKLRIVQ